VGGDANIPQSFNLNQDGVKLNGTGGPDSAEQYPILNGSVAGDSIRFELRNRQRTLLYELRLEDNELRGTLSIKSANETRTTEVRLERVK
jgi:hypothetical protein